jgi:hypothetical protein
MKILLAFLIAASASTTFAQGPAYGSRVARLPQSIVAQLAEHNAPDGDGAMGRNRNGYFHVRLQAGMHHLADDAVAESRPEAAGQFFRAAEYSFRHQMADGDFSLVVPSGLKGQGLPRQADRASGVAFFASSLGAGIQALETSDWFTRSAECESLRQRLAALKPKVRKTLDYLLEHQELLQAADRRAPNRLLFDALAFHTLGKILHDEQAIKIASRIVGTALKQVHQDGYFIEGSGFDSSYNGVATALGFRLVLMGYGDDHLDAVCRKAVRWQRTRVAETGEIITRGNSRVDPDGQGESFLGRTKDIDVAHTVEAFMLASLQMDDTEYQDLARRVLAHYL